MLVVGFLACQFSLLEEKQEHQELMVSFKDIRIEIKDICYVTFITFFVVFQIWHQYQKGIRRQVVHYLVCALQLEIFFRLDSLVVVLCGTMFGAGSASVHVLTVSALMSWWTNWSSKKQTQTWRARTKNCRPCIVSCIYELLQAMHAHKHIWMCTKEKFGNSLTSL